jgi:GT2 family glycosyltransferase
LLAEQGRLEKLQAETASYVANLQQAIAIIHHSTSWKLTSPLRSAVLHLRQIGTHGQSLRKTVERLGGSKMAIRKALFVLRREGVKGVWDRLVSHMRVSGAIPEYERPEERGSQRCPELSLHSQSVDVIICVHNALEDLRRCLDSVLAYSLPPARFIIVDDGSDAETSRFLKEFGLGQPITLIRNETAQGYTRAANIGLKASTADFVVLLNSDTIVPSRWLDRLIRCAQSDERIGMVGPLSNTASWQSVPLVFDEQGDWAENPLPDGWTLVEYAARVAMTSRCIFPRVGFLNGFCLLLKRALLDDLGLFDEETFGRGYGEENDYCLRTAEKGWHLAIADDCYVYHAQSKSYSTAQRQTLVRSSDKALVQKHGRGLIDQQLAVTRNHPALYYIRGKCRSLPEINQVRETIRSRFAGKRILFLLPAGTACGGGNIILLECTLMRELGVDAWVGNLQGYRELFEQHHPSLTVPVLYLPKPEDLEIYAQDFDAVVATLYLTVYWLKPLLGMSSPPQLGYYIQDFEPDFFAPGSLDYQLAMKSYTAMPEVLLFTKTEWNRSALMEKCGVSPQVIGPSMNVDGFFPSELVEKNQQAVRITAMVRPSTPRRAPEMTMRVLRKLKEKYQQQVAVFIFGVDPANPEYLGLEPDFAHQCLGELSAERVADLLRQSDIFVDCSKYQAMGLTAMEAMACGVVTVGPKNGGLQEIITHGKTGILVDTEDEYEIIAAIIQLIENPKLRGDISLNAFSVVRYAPEFSVYKMLDNLLEKVRQDAAVGRAVGEPG